MTDANRAGLGRQYRKRPVVVEAMQWTGLNISEAKALAGDKVIERNNFERPNGVLLVNTANGFVHAGVGDWIVRDPESGDTWPVAADRFAATYEEVTDES